MAIGGDSLTDAFAEAQRRLRYWAARAGLIAWNTDWGVGPTQPVTPEGEPGGGDVITTLATLAAAARAESVRLTDMFTARRLGRDPLGIDPEEISKGLREGRAPDVVYRRPYISTYRKLAIGVPIASAVAVGGVRLASTIATDVQLAAFSTVKAIGERDDRIVGWERVPNGGACDLCLMASTQRYHSGDLQPIHNRCGCAVEPITRDSRDPRGDPGQVIHPDLLNALKESGRATDLSLSQSVSRYRKLGDTAKADEFAGRLERHREQMAAGKFDDYSVHHHGELGPVLTRKGDHFTTEAEALA